MAATVVWCVIVFTTSLESNVPKMCFDARDQCRAYIAALDLSAAQCSRRQDRSK